MKIYRSISEFKKITNAVITTGTFDGLHLGHCEILNKLVEISKRTSFETVILTFSPHPRHVLFPTTELKLINTIDENIKLYENHNIDHLIFHPFSFEFSRTTSLEYIRDILVQKIGLKDLVIGHNHQFGRNREGEINSLEEYADLFDFNIHTVLPFKFKNIEVSSTKIRNAIIGGDIELANNYLGYNFHITGLVVRGNGLGHKIGFPTANIEISDSKKIIPQNGVYSVFINHNTNRFKGMLNIGYKPTVSNEIFTIEVNIFDFKQQIYNEPITVEFVKKIRDEIKFKNIQELQQQLEQDKISTINILSRYL
tara:strand:+ start:13723 stop:14655 length:933 start_codon:yes stop_codon:yes gene_type:complete